MGGLVKDRKGNVFEGRGWYPNGHYETGNNFNCDINLLVPMSSLLILNRTVLSCNWLATKNNFWCRQGVKKCKFQIHYLDKKTLSFSNLKHVFFYKMWACLQKSGKEVSPQITVSKYTKSRRKNWFFWHNSYQNNFQFTTKQK